MLGIIATLVKLIRRRNPEDQNKRVFADGQQPIQLLKRYKKDQLSTRC